MVPRLAEFFGLTFAISLTTVIFLALGLWMGGRWVAHRVEDDLGQPIRTRWTEWLFGLQSTSLRNIVFTAQRAATGKPAEHPMGSPRPPEPWLDQIAFDPATWFPAAKPRSAPIDLTTVLGTGASRPLVLRLPVLVAPMGYGLAVNRLTKIALAQAATAAGTATSSGEGPFLPEERADAARWILQWGRGPWNHHPNVIALADMVEIQIGQGSEASTGVIKTPRHLPRRIRQASDRPWAPVHLRGGLVRPLPAWINRIRRAHPGIPIGVKLPATAHLESDLAALAALDIDVVTLDGAEAATGSSPAVIADHFGIPTAIAVVRARRWLDHHHHSGRIQLVASGGARSAADVAKLLALGADAVSMGTALLFALSHTQISHLPVSAGPTQLVLSRRSPTDLDLDSAAEHLTRWFSATRQELELILQALGIQSLVELCPCHLVAHTPSAASALGVRYLADPAPPLVAEMSALTATYAAMSRVLTQLLVRWPHLYGMTGSQPPPQR